MKELPLTLILRPFNFDTLATFVYQYASDELLRGVRTRCVDHCRRGDYSRSYC